MTKSACLGVVVAIAAALAAACAFEHEGTSVTPTSPSAASSLLGTWSSVASVGAGASSCTSFQWAVTSQVGNSVSGAFSAICGATTIVGTASGQVNGQDVPYQASGSATPTSGVACNFSLRGTAHIEGDRLRVPYSGTTCLGSTQGEEVLRRR